MTETERILRQSEARGWPADDHELAALRARKVKERAAKAIETLEEAIHER